VTDISVTGFKSTDGMKTLINIVFIISFCHCYTQSQVLVHYKVADNAYILNEEELKKAPEGIRFAVVNSQKIYPHLVYTLMIKNKTESYFKNANEIIPQIGHLSEKLSEMIYNIALKNISQGNYYTNLSDSLIVKEVSLQNQKFLINYSTQKYQWQLKNDFKMINDFKCFKATADVTFSNGVKTSLMKVTAWYAPGIPISLGPKGYAGLPGLILELQEDGIGIYASKIELNPQEFKIPIPTKGKRITEKQYNELQKEMFDKTLELHGGR
jgi:GLPGLI family protein